MLSEKYAALREENAILKTEVKNLKGDLKRLMLDAKNEKKLLQSYSRALLLRQEEDRREISRELHDEIGQILTAINYELEILAKEAMQSEAKIRKRITNAQHMIIGSVDTIYRFAKDLRPFILDDLGLSAALHSYIKDFHKKNSIVVKLHTDIKGLKLDDFGKTILFRIVQEALVNISKHSKAKNASISLSKDKHQLKIVIQDDGQSFKSNRTTNFLGKRGIGLLGMHERIKILDGTISFRPLKNGTCIEILVQLSNLRPKYTPRKR